MAWQIIKQPDGRFCIWSTVTDSVIVYDATEQEIVDEFANTERRKVADRTQEILNQINAGRNILPICRAVARGRKND